MVLRDDGDNRRRPSVRITSPADDVVTGNASVDEVSKLLQRADAAYYAAKWPDAEDLLHRCWARLDGAKTDHQTAESLAYLRGRCARELALVKFQRGATFKAWLQRARRGARQRSGASRFRRLEFDVAVVESYQQRCVGRFQTASNLLDGLDPRQLGDDEDWGVIRLAMERAHISRNIGEFASAKTALLTAFAAIIKAETSRPTWGKGWLRVQHLLFFHYLGVIAVERLLWGAASPHGEALAELARQDLLTSAAHCEAVEGEDESALKHYVIRNEKVLAWCDVASGRPAEALARLAPVIQTAASIGDWRTVVIAQAARASALATTDLVGAQREASAAWRLANEHDYWRGRLWAIQVNLALHARAPSGDAASWLARLHEMVRTSNHMARPWLEQIYLGAERRLASASIADVPLWPVDPTPPSEAPTRRRSDVTPPCLAQEFERLAHEWHDAVAFENDLTRAFMHRAYQRIIALGPPAIPLLLRALQREGDWWFWALRALTGDDPVPATSRGNLEQMRSAWLDWGRERGYLGS